MAKKKLITKTQFESLCDLLDASLDTSRNGWCVARDDDELIDLKALRRRGLVGWMQATYKSGRKEDGFKCNQAGADYIIEHWAEFYPNDPPYYSKTTDKEKEIPQPTLTIA